MNILSLYDGMACGHKSEERVEELKNNMTKTIAFMDRMGGAIMAEFDEELYMCKALTMNDEVLQGFYVKDYILGKDIQHGIITIPQEKVIDGDVCVARRIEEINPYTLCRNTGIKIADTYLYEYDIVSYFEPMRDKKQYGFIDFDEFYKCFIVRTGIEHRATRLLRDCSKIEFANRNIVLNDVDFNWFAEWEKAEFEKSKSHIIDNSYCPSRFRR